MQNNRVWERACGLTATVVGDVRFDEAADAIVVSARPDARARSRCGLCGRRSPGYDHGRDVSPDYENCLKMTRIR